MLKIKFPFRFAVLVFFLQLFPFSSVFGQTLIINEVSNGLNGNKEWVELVVMDTNVVYSCSANALPPSIDIRGWIIDDNSGYHGTGIGVAAGCARFSFDPMWAAVPVGTIIVIYNNADKDPSIPPDDLSMTDGNCRIIAPINNTSLFERNATTPGAFLCSYPMTGWLAGGNWNNIVLANTGDCMRIVNTSGCEVFSVAYAQANQNPMIYFSSGGTGANNVWYFNSGSPFLQANWSEGCTNPANCGSNDQTPGVANNAANQAFLNSLNNSCVPIPVLSIAPSASVNAQCGCNGSASVSASGSIPGYTYIWTPTPPSGQGTATASGLCPGTYKCVVTSFIGCKDSLQFTVSGSVAIDASVVGTNVLCFGDSSSTASASFNGGNGGVTFSWSPAPGTGQGTGNVSGLTAQSYTITVSDAANCSDTAIFTPVQPPELQITFSITPVSCFGFSDGSVNITVSGGVPAYSFLWSNGAATEDISNLLAGQFALTAFDANNCVIRDTFAVTEPTLLSATINSSPVICKGDSTGSASVSVNGGTSAYSFVWQPYGSVDSVSQNLIAGNYTCTVIDVNSCSTSVSATITEPSLLTASVSTVGAPCSGNGGSASVNANGGVPGYSYLWLPVNDTASTALSLTAGIYTVIVTDANACADTLTANVQNIDGPTVSVSATGSVTCFGLSNGSALADTSGGAAPLSVVWTPLGGTQVSADSLSAGTYTITVSDANGCIAVSSTTVIEPPLLTTTISGVDVLCNGQAEGVASVQANGGIGNYQYAWLPAGGSFSQADSLFAGTYSVVVMDANSCADTAQVTIQEPSALIISLTATATTCGESNGLVQAQVIGGISGYQYLWNPGGATSSALTSVTAGTYTCTVADANNCTITQTILVPASSPASASISSTSNVSCFGLSDGSAAVSASGVAPVSYSWIPLGGNASTVSNLTAGTYFCIVTDSTNCVDSVQVNITEPSDISIASSFTNAACFNQSSGLAVVQASGGTPLYSFNWIPSGGTFALATNLGAGTYTCVVTDANSCKDSISLTISEPSQLSLSLSATLINCYNPSTTITSSASGGTPNYSYQWQPAGTGSNPSGLSAGTYTLSLTDSLGCNITQTISVPTDTASPNINAGSDDTLSCLPGSSLSLSGTTTNFGATYTWVGPNGFTAALPNPFINQPGTYTFSVFNPANGCSASDSVVISQLPGPIAVISANPPTGVAPLSVGFNSAGSGAVSYVWNFGNGTTSSSVADSSLYTLPGAYTATLVVSDALGCTDTATQIILVNEAFSILIPNVFTPNADGENDFFFIPATGIRTMNLKIFDRWGLVMAELTSPQQSWDGKTASGENVPDGTYYFVLTYSTQDGQDGTAKGYLLLIR